MLTADIVQVKAANDKSSLLEIADHGIEEAH